MNQPRDFVHRSRTAAGVRVEVGVIGVTSPHRYSIKNRCRYCVSQCTDRPIAILPEEIDKLLQHVCDDIVQGSDG